MRTLASFVFLCFCVSGGAFGRVLVNGATTIVIGSDEPGPLQKAAADLAGDFGRVFGRRAAIVHSPALSRGTAIRIALADALPSGIARPSGWERLSIQANGNSITLTGSDVRGAIYAVYEFSQRFLGVDPLYYWTDHAPRRRADVVVPDNFALTEGPGWHYRGWFINDEDLFTAWKPGVQQGTGIALELWDHIFEAILRLKGDMVVPGTWIFPYEPQIQAAAERGLIVTQHHVNTLGLDTYRWPKDRPMSFLNAPDLLEAAWKTAASEYPKNVEVLWSVGFRGQNDYPFWLNDPNAPKTDEGRAKIIRAAIDKQIEIVRELHPDAQILMNAWREAATFIHEGFLKIPNGVTLVWPDNGHGLLEDKGEIGAGQGEYYHTAMFDYMSNHYSEMVPLERIQRELGRAARAGATRWLLINTANVRPVVMTTRAVMDLAWNPEPWSAEGSNQASRYLDRWSREEYGDAAAPAVVDYYKQYFAAPARYGEAEDATAADNFYQTAARAMLLAEIDNDQRLLARLHGRIRFANLQELAAKLAEACQAADARWMRAEAAAKRAAALVPNDRQEFFRANVMTQVDLHLHFNRMVLRLAEMVQARDALDKSAKLRLAIDEGKEGLDAMRDADYGKWQDYYTAGDWLLNTPLTIALANTYLDRLQGRPISLDTVIRAKDTGFAYHMITAYQGTQTVQF
jgi:hypothetical protein